MNAFKKILVLALCLLTLTAALFALSACGKEEAEECPHSWTEWKTVVKASCQTEGLERRTCKLNSAHIEERTVEKTAHNFDDYVPNGDETCLSNGTKTAYCSTLGCTATNTIENIGSKLEHNFNKTVIADKYLQSAASCTRPAKYYHSCECGTIGSTTFEYGDIKHNYSDLLYDENEHWYECSVCEKKVSEKHVFGEEGELISEANCTEDGLTVYSCDCGTVKEVVTPAFHTLKKIDAVSATCQTGGSIEYWQCEVEDCLKYFRDENGEFEIKLSDTVTSPVEHNYIVWIFDDATHAKKCEWCNEKTSGVAHSFSESFDEAYHFTSCECGYKENKEFHTLSIKSSTDTHWYECSECNYISKETEHEKNWTYDEGTHSTTCPICNFTSATVPHVWDEGVITIPPLCYEEGEKLCSCECGATKTVPVSAAHALISVDAKESTCTEHGNIAHFKCTACEKLFSDESAALEIKYEDTLTAKKAHEFTVHEKDADYHWLKCEACEAIDSKVAHEFTTLNHDADGHWYTCDCGCDGTLLAHEWGEGEAVSAPDCFNGEEKLFTCLCGETKTEFSPSTHSVNTIPAKDATCTENGNIEYRFCFTCGKCYDKDENKQIIITDTVIVAPGHDFENGTLGMDDYNHWVQCKNCEERDSVTAHSTTPSYDDDYHFDLCPCGKKLNVTLHSWDLGTVTKEPDCFESGVKLFVCECGAEKETELDKLSHDETEYKANEPTCVLTGNIAYFHCENCKKYYSDEDCTNEISYESTIISATGVHTPSGIYSGLVDGHREKCSGCEYYFDLTAHNFVDLEDEFVTADCKTAGYKVHKCLDCNYKEKYEETPKTACEYETITDKAADCETPGEARDVCKNCGASVSYSLPTLGHSYDLTNPDYNEIISPDCENDGYTKHFCTRVGCDNYYTDSIVESEGHNLVKDEALSFAETCTEDGLLVERCSVCHTYTEETEIDEIEGHNWIDSTCTAVGYCSVCGTESGEPLKAHSLTLLAETHANCTEDGVKSYKCDHCNYTEFTTEKAKGHNVTAWEQTTELIDGETCAYRTVNSGICTDCSEPVYEYGEDIAYEHNFVYTEISIPAKCNAEGVKLYTCDKCNSETRTESYTDATAHYEGCGHVQVSGSADATISSGTSTDTVVLDNATIGFDSATKEQIQNAGSDVSVSAGTLSKDEVDEEFKTQLEGKDFDTIVSLEITGIDSSEFDGYVTVKVPYELGDGDPDDVIVAYIAKDKLVYIQATYVEIDGEGYAVFTTNHFSYYTVTELSASERCKEFGHLYTSVTVPATCMSDGYTLTICRRCNEKEITNVVSALGHDWIEDEASKTELGCETNGYLKTKCSRCGLSFEEITPATGHNWTLDLENSSEANCQTEGREAYVCENCGESYEKTLAKTKHSYVYNEELSRNASCTEAGVRHEDCENCGAVKESAIPKLSHTLGEKVIAPSCIAGGYTVKYCTACDTEISKYNFTTTSDHRFEGKADCVNDLVCADCGKLSEKALGHSMHLGVCQRCGEGCEHVWSENAIRTESATCASGGKDVYECTVCHLEEKRDNGEEAAEHVYSLLYVTPATCHSASFKTFACSVCGDSYSEEASPALSHEFVDGYCKHCGVSSDNFYLGLLDSITGVKGLAIKLEDLKYDFSELISVIEGWEIEGKITSTEISELMLYIDENGKLQGAISASFEVYNYDGNKTTMTFGVKGLISGDVMYIEIRQNGRVVEYYTMSVDFIVGNLFEGLEYADLSEIIGWLEENVLPILKEFKDANAESINKLLGNALNVFFGEVRTEEGTKLVFDYEKLYALNENLATMTVAEFINFYFGESAYFDLQCEITYILSLELKDVPAYLDSIGLDSESLFAAINDMVKLMFGAPESYDIKAMLEDPEMSGITIGMMLMQTEEYSKQLEEIFAMLEGASLYEIVSGMLFDGDVTADEIKKTVDGVIAMLEESVMIVINTDLVGNITSFVIKIDSLEIKMGEEKITFSCTLTITPDGKINVSWGDIIDGYNSTVKLPEISSGETVYDWKESEGWSSLFIDGVEYEGYYYGYERYKDGLNADSPLYTLVTKDCGDWYSVGAYYERYEAVTGIAFHFATDVKTGENCVLITAFFLDNVIKATFDENGNVVFTNDEGELVTVSEDDMNNPEEVIIKVFGDVVWTKTYSYPVAKHYYYNSVTGEFSDYSQHNYELNEESSYKPTDCGHDGYREYVCTNCGDTVGNYYNGFEHEYKLSEELSDIRTECESTSTYVYVCTVCGDENTVKFDKNHNYDTRYQLSEGAHSCYEGLDRIEYCRDCGKVLKTAYKDYYGHVSSTATVIEDGYVKSTALCEVCGEADSKGSFKYKLETAEDIKPVNDYKSGYRTSILAFTPTESNFYLFYATSSASNISASILDEYFNEIQYSDWNEYTYNFGMNIWLEAGETYYLYIYNITDDLTVYIEAKFTKEYELSSYGSSCGGKIYVTNSFGINEHWYESLCDGEYDTPCSVCGFICYFDVAINLDESCRQYQLGYYTIKTSADAEAEYIVVYKFYTGSTSHGYSYKSENPPYEEYVLDGITYRKYYSCHGSYCFNCENYMNKTENTNVYAVIDGNEYSVSETRAEYSFNNTSGVCEINRKDSHEYELYYGEYGLSSRETLYESVYYKNGEIDSWSKTVKSYNPEKPCEVTVTRSSRYESEYTEIEYYHLSGEKVIEDESFNTVDDDGNGIICTVKETYCTKCFATISKTKHETTMESHNVTKTVSTSYSKWAVSEDEYGYFVSSRYTTEFITFTKDGKTYSAVASTLSEHFAFDAENRVEILESYNKAVYVYDEGSYCSGRVYYYDRFNNLINDHEIDQHVHRYYSYELLEGSEYCTDGISVYYCCAGCDVKDFQYESHEHYLTNEEEYNASDFGSYCGGTFKIQSCACGVEKKVDTENLNCDMSSSFPDYNYGWNEDGTVYNYFKDTYTCATSYPEICGFSWSFERWYSRDDKCMQVYHTRYVFGIGSDNPLVIETMIGSDEYLHVREDFWDTDTKYEDGYIISVNTSGSRCAICGTLINEYINYGYYLDDGTENGTYAYRTYEQKEYYASGELSRYSLITYNNITINGFTEDRTVEELNYYYDKDGNITGFEEKTYEYTDCLNSYRVYYVTSYREPYWQPFAHSIYDMNLHAYNKLPTCTQDGEATWRCLCCGAERTEAVSAFCHSFAYYSETSLYECTYCGLISKTNRNGSYVLEDLTAKLGNGESFVIGYKHIGESFDNYIVVELIVGEESYILFNSLYDSAIAKDGSTISVSVLAVKEQIEALGLDVSLCESSVRVSIVPMSGDYTHDYSITLDAHVPQITTNITAGTDEFAISHTTHCSQCGEILFGDEEIVCELTILNYSYTKDGVSYYHEVIYCFDCNFYYTGTETSDGSGQRVAEYRYTLLGEEKVHTIIYN